MFQVLIDLLMVPFKIAALLIEAIGRTLAIIAGLALFGIGALLCTIPLLIIFGAPLCLLGAIIVVKAL